MGVENFITTVITPLGDGQLIFSKLSGSEELGRLFEFEIELLRSCDNGSVDSSQLLGHDITVKLAPSQGTIRYFNGAVVAFKHTGIVNRYYTYRATLRPWLWFLTLNANCQIFQDKSIPDIIKAVFANYTFADVEYHLGDYPTLIYCVQYRESDFNFVSRLMEHAGIFYYFKHIEGKHTLVVTDSGSNYQQIAGYDNIQYYPPGNIANRDSDHIYEWLSAQQVATGKYAHTDFNFETPSADLTAKAQKLGSHNHNDLEVFDFPGKYGVVDAGTNLSDRRIEELHRQDNLINGCGNALALQPGLEFTLKGFYFADQNVKHFIVSANYDLGGGGGNAAGNATGDSLFTCRFVAMNSQQSFRSARISEKPVIPGAQTAIVVGKDGEEIWTDKYGRIKVKFHWDRDPQKNEQSSCWIRVSYPIAGKKWGGVSLPRMGQEVIVSFLHGDPDQPLITGSVYNAEQMPPYDLPDNQTQSGMKSRSSKTGVADNFNEIRFEDKKDSEEVYVHAEKDFNCVIENNETRQIGVVKKDKGDQTIEIQNDRTITLNEGNDTLHVKKGNRESNIDIGNHTLNVKQGNHLENVDQGNATLNVKLGNNNINVSVGDHIVKVDAGNAKVTAMQSIELKVGGSSIKMDPGSITIKAPMITIQADGMLEAKSPMTTVKGDGILILKGGITLIN